MYNKLLVVLVPVLLLSGCTSTPLIERFKFGMTKDQVTHILGSTMVPRGVAFNKFEQTVEVYEYDRLQPTTDRPKGAPDPSLVKPTAYYLFFYKDRLVQWGEADDWREAAKALYDTRFR